ncbi:hypothetical protein FOMPIDRAFT_37369, partial [Fomitopsis schrenkii]
KRVFLHGPRAERQEGGNLGSSSADSFPRLSNEGDSPRASKRTTVSEELEGTPLEEIEPTDGFSSSQDENSSLLDHMAEGQAGVNIIKEVRNRYHEDSFFGDILREPKHYKNFDVKEGLIHLKDKGTYRLCIPDVTIDGRSAREIVIRHAHSMLAHLGAVKTLSYLRDQVWWKT